MKDQDQKEKGKNFRSSWSYHIISFHVFSKDYVMLILCKIRLSKGVHRGVRFPHRG